MKRYHRPEADELLARTLSKSGSTVTLSNAGGSFNDAVDDAVDSEDNPASSGGGGCTYNQNSKSFDMMFLFIAALGFLFPFRRRFLK